MEDYQIPSVDKIKDNHWYEVYFDLEKKIEEQRDTNEKQEHEIIRRTKRYQKNELEYRQQIEILQRELRIRKGFEKNADQANQALQEKYKREIYKNIDDYDEHLQRLQDE